MNPQEERALVLIQALRDADLEQLTATLHTAGLLSRPLPQVRANLKAIFAQAQADHVNLLHPPADFQTWLYGPLHHHQHGKTVSPNTVIARLSTLRGVYQALLREELIGRDPLRDFPSPPPVRSTDPLPSAAEIRQLLLHAAALDDTLCAALTLTYEHAMQARELIALRWGALDSARGTLLRRRTLSVLSASAQAALQPLLTRAGGPLHASEELQIFPYDSLDALRLQTLKLCRAANVEFVSPAVLRRCGLRDHDLTAQQAGFSDPQAYKLALDVAQTLGVRGREES
ncbi:hypothetical protein [Deinococcus aquatilis]|uniref:hypothetical protein n=1 Tax=Deinococcus aquatilis TaxID=519440 RepID=UPI00037B16E4|nr:hypothetical protein [Deinococcus aquatilis]